MHSPPKCLLLLDISWNTVGGFAIFYFIFYKGSAHTVVNTFKCIRKQKIFSIGGLFRTVRGLFVWLVAIGMFSNVKLLSELLDILAFDSELNRHSALFVLF